jgi:MFS family permease
MTETNSGTQVVAHGPEQASNAWRILALLAAANVLNFYDRTLPAILVEPIKEEFNLTDSHIGVLSASFIVVYAIAGVWLGRLADLRSRRAIMGWGLVVWSVFTALSAGAWSFTSILLVRLGVGVGEASYAPAANSLLADLYPATRRSRAVAIFQFGIPIGTILAFFTTGLIVDAFDSWRAPFVVAAIPGLVLAVFLMRIKEPARGAADASHHPVVPARSGGVAPWRQVLRISTMRWLVVSSIGVQVAAYSIGTFVVPLLQRYYGLSLTVAALYAGVILGVAALAGLVVSGTVADRASRRSLSRRVLVGAIALTVAAPLALLGMSFDPNQLAAFVAVMSLVSFFQFFFHTSALPAVADVVPPQLRGSAIAVFFAASYLLGGAFGPIITGVLSDAFAATGHGVSAEAHGLNLSLMIVLPVSLLVSALGFYGAARRINADHQKMTADLITA